MLKDLIFKFVFKEILAYQGSLPEMYTNGGENTLKLHFFVCSKEIEYVQVMFS